MIVVEPIALTEDTAVLRRRDYDALIEAYEKEAYPFDPPDPIEAIQFRMEQLGLTRKDLEPFIGSRARVAEIMNRKRGLSIEMIRRINEGLGISADILIRPTREDKAA